MVPGWLGWVGCARSATGLGHPVASPSPPTENREGSGTRSADRLRLLRFAVRHPGKVVVSEKCVTPHNLRWGSIGHGRGVWCGRMGTF